jgi:hypothetical protein
LPPRSGGFAAARRALQAAALATVAALVLREAARGAPGTAAAAGAQPAERRLIDTPRAAGRLGRGSGGAVSPVTMWPKRSDASAVVAHPTAAPFGGAGGFYFRFTNVRLYRGALELYAGAGAAPPAPSALGPAFDLAAGAAASPAPPAALRLPGGGALPLRYRAGTRPACAAGEVAAPALLLAAPPGAALASAFHTLRELRYLDLVEVDAGGGVARVAAGLAPGCPLAWDATAKCAAPAAACAPPADAVSPALPAACARNDTTTPWCAPGVWPAPAPRAWLGRPALAVVAPGTAVEEIEWGAVLSAAAGRVLRLDADPAAARGGLCFRNLIVGFSQALVPGGGGELSGAGGDDSEAAAAAAAVRAHSADADADAAAALGVYVRFARSALRRLERANAVDFGGYAGAAAERLRRGLAPGSPSGAARAAFAPAPGLAARPTPASDLAWREDLRDYLALGWVFDPGHQRTLTPAAERPALLARAAAALAASAPSGAAAPEGQRGGRVVAYVTAWPAYEAAILNDAAVLLYLQRRFNATIRVTSITEPAAAAAALLGAADAVAGALRGDAWDAAAPFLRAGAPALRLAPFGWRAAGGDGGRGAAAARLRGGAFLEWENPHAALSFFRREDFAGGAAAWRAQPAAEGDEWAPPAAGGDGAAVHPAWLNAATYADLNDLGPHLDALLAAIGLQPLQRGEADALAARLEAERAARLAARAAAAAPAAGIETNTDKTA